MVVIVIIGLLAAVAIPKFSSISDTAKVSEFPTILTGIYTNQEGYHTEQGSYASDLLTMQMTLPVSNWFSYSIHDATDTSYICVANVLNNFGDVFAGVDSASINNAGIKKVTGTKTFGLKRHAPQW